MKKVKSHCPTCKCGRPPALPEQPPKRGLPQGLGLLLKLLALSMLLHILTIRGCGGDGEGDADGKGSGTPETQFVPKSPVTVDVDPNFGDGVIRPTKKTLNCLGGKNQTYGGIGIHIDRRSGRKDMVVEDVAPGYVGDKMGLKPGYRLKSKEEIKGEPGTEVEITIYPNDGTPVKTVTVEREEICFFEKEPSAP